MKRWSRLISDEVYYTLFLFFFFYAFAMIRGFSLDRIIPKFVRLRLQIPFHWVFRNFHDRAFGPFVVGSASVFLPCGWLYTFVLAAVATQNIWKGALVLIFFWLGTLPVMTAVSSMSQWVLRKRWMPSYLSAFLLISIAVIIIGIKRKRARIKKRRSQCVNWALLQ